MFYLNSQFLVCNNQMCLVQNQIRMVYILVSKVCLLQTNTFTGSKKITLGRFLVTFLEWHVCETDMKKIFLWKPQKINNRKNHLRLIHTATVNCIFFYCSKFFCYWDFSNYLHASASNACNFCWRMCYCGHVNEPLEFNLLKCASMKAQ